MWEAVGGRVQAARKGGMAIELSRLIDALPGLVWTALPDGRADFLNGQWCEYTGLSAEEALGTGWHAAIHPVDLPQLLEFWDARITAGAPGEIEIRLRRHDGDYRRFLFSAAPLRDESGEIYRWCGINTDIENRWRAEYQQAVRQITVAQGLSHTGSFTADVWADEHDWSEELYRIFEIEPGTEISVADIQALIVPDGRQEFGRGFGEAVEQRARYDHIFRILTPSGDLKSLHAVAQYSGEIAGRPLYIGAIQDISSQKAAEEALKESEGELRRLISLLTEAERVSKTGSFLADLVHDVSVWSEELYRIYGLEPRSTIATDEVTNLTHPDDRDLIEHEIASAKAGAESLDFAFRIVASDGAVKHVRCVARANDDIAQGRVFVGAIQDLTDIRLAEEALDQARAEFAHLARLTAMSTLTASIAHEVNQPLAGIITNASTCLRMLGADPPDLAGARATAQRTLRDGGRASEIIQRLRQMFARTRKEVELFDLRDAVVEVLALTANELRRAGILVEATAQADEAIVSGDRVQLQQVIMNLVLNSADSMRHIKDHPRKLRVGTSSQDGEIQIEVVDSGPGIADDVLPRLFDPFFTTKASGMGIGLSVSKSIVENHGGRLWASNNRHSGATFAFSLPAAEQHAAAHAKDIPPNAREKGSGDGL